MKRIKWIYLSAEINYGTEEKPNIKQIFVPKDFPYYEESLDAAKREAYNGEYEIYDDGQAEPITQPTYEERIAELEEVLEMLLSGVTE
jgi:hypothetical protein